MNRLIKEDQDKITAILKYTKAEKKVLNTLEAWPYYKLMKDTIPADTPVDPRNLVYLTTAEGVTLQVDLMPFNTGVLHLATVVDKDVVIVPITVTKAAQ